MKLEFISKLENKDFELCIYGSNEDGFDASDITINWHVDIQRSASMIKDYNAYVDSVKGFVIDLDSDFSIDVSEFEQVCEDNGSGTSYISTIEIEIEKKLITFYFN